MTVTKLKLKLRQFFCGHRLSATKIEFSMHCIKEETHCLVCGKGVPPPFRDASWADRVDSQNTYIKWLEWCRQQKINGTENNTYTWSAIHGVWLAKKEN